MTVNFFKSLLCSALVAVFLLTLSFPAYAASSSLDQWDLYSSGTTNDLTGITYGNGLFVATCYLNKNSDQNYILTSPNGVTWASHLAALNCRLYDVTFGNGTFVAVGTGTKVVESTWQCVLEDGGAILTSKDGTNWTQIPGITVGLRSVTYGNGTFVAVGGNTILTSTDGITWTSRSSNVSVDLKGVCYGNGLFVAVGPENGYTSGLRCDASYILTSPDGVTWASHKIGTTELSSVTYGNGLFVAVGTSTTAQLDHYYKGAIVTSMDGSTWTIQHSGTDSVLNGVSYGDGLYVAVGVNFNKGTNNIWQFILNDSEVSDKDWMRNLSYAKYIGEIQTSPDGINWTIQREFTSNNRVLYNTLDGVACGNGSFVAVGGNGTIIKK